MMDIDNAKRRHEKTNMEYTEKLSRQSIYWYNDGLKKANIRDLSGAIISLRKSLQYNRNNSTARNLLGLVYYGRGDVVEALVEWILSRHFDPNDNIADEYIRNIQEEPEELEKINQAVKHYNQSLNYSMRDGEDLAILSLRKAVDLHPGFVKAWQLLGLLYIVTEKFAKARQAVRKAYKYDKTDEITLSYMHEINEIMRQRTVHIKESEKQSKDTVEYKVGNETIIQPAEVLFRESTQNRSVFHMVIGGLCGVAIMLFLIFPAVDSYRQKQVNQQVLELSDTVAEQKTLITSMEKELDEYKANADVYTIQETNTTSTIDSYEIVMNVYTRYYANDTSDADMMEEMLKVNPDKLGPLGRAKYDEIANLLYPRTCKRLLKAAQGKVASGDHAGAITDLNNVVKMIPGYESGSAMLLLAQCYEATGDLQNANAYYHKIIDEMAGTQAAGAAQSALDAQAASAAQTTQNQTDAGAQAQ